MAQIRGTIELLTNILRENGASKLKAETFRLAKFNNDDAVRSLWVLLFELVYYCEYGRIDEISVKAVGELSTEELVVYVKREVQKRGFHSREFANLPNDMSSGSRELLLALGWLLCKENIITKFMRSSTSSLDDDTQALVEGESDDRKLSNRLQLLESPSDPRERVQQLLWLNNKLRLNLRTLHAMQLEKNRLKHKLHEATWGVSLDSSRNHLSMLEIYMLRHPELLKKNLYLLEKDNERLQNLLCWKDQEDRFWKWMESVLDAKLQENNMAVPSHPADNRNRIYNIPPESVARLHESHDELQNAIMKYEKLIERLEGLWESRSTDVSEEELDNLLASIDLEISIQRANIALTNCENFVRKQQEEPRFVLEKKAGNRSTSQYSQTPAAAFQANEKLQDIRAEICRLGSVVHELRKEIEDKHIEYTEEIMSVSENMSDIILIPPMGRKTLDF